MIPAALSVFLLAVLQASSAWDASNIWFPDPNNPVFYNMTFYQEAKKAVQQMAPPPQSPPPRRGESAVEQEAARPAEQERTRPTWSRVALDNQRRQQGVKGQDNRNTGSAQQSDSIGYKPVSSQDNSRLRDIMYRKMTQPRGNRIPSRDYQEEVGYRSAGEQEYQDRDVRQSAVMDTARQDTRQWRNTVPAGNDATNTVDGNIISAIETTSKSSRPSKCVWAIISCCKPTSSEIRYMCFEALGCHGAFWDNNPCSKEMTLAAVQSTANFYNVPITDE